MTAIAFDLPHALEASAPAGRRDAVRLLVASTSGIQHAHFGDLAEYLTPGDLLVVNTSRTLPAAVGGIRRGGQRVVVHFSTALDDDHWVVEVRPTGDATGPVDDLTPGETITLPHAVPLTVVSPLPPGQRRLWRARVLPPEGVIDYLTRVGSPIRYPYVRARYPLSAYQTVFAREPGSAEMPSAARPFTTRLVTRLVTAGITIAPILLHTGVSSPEVGEAPAAERFRVPEATARLVNATRAQGRRVIAVGTTVTRALESTVDASGQVAAYAGWTDRVLSVEQPARVTTGLITGWHAPQASHLRLLETVAGTDMVSAAYAAALRERYLWHEFGDSCLLLP